MKSFLFVALTFGFLLLSPPVLAHQPRVVESNEIIVVDPDISKAYYGTLTGEPHVYTISASEPFELYVGILMPYDEQVEKDVIAEIKRNGQLLASIGGGDAQWEMMFEFFGQSSYWDGGEYKEGVDAGEYTISVSSTYNDSKYSLAIGETEAFDSIETVNALKLIPELKRDFFNESPISFIKSPFGWGSILILYTIAFVVGFLYRTLLRMFAKNSVRGAQKNIGTFDRFVRFAIWIGLLFFAILTTWSPVLLFFSGFALFEALFSWCGFYAALGKTTCLK